MIAERDIQNDNFQDMINIMSHYEQGALLQYADQDADKLVVGNALNPLYIETSDDIIDKLKNPYKDFYYWVKGEIYDIQALNDCLEGLNRVVKQKEKLEAKKKTNEQTLDKIKSGKTTFKTIFSNDAKKEQIANTVESETEIVDRDIELYDKIINVLQSYIAKNVIDRFKQEKQKVYYRLLLLFSVNEIHNSHLVLGFWRSFLANKNIVGEQEK